MGRILLKYSSTSRQNTVKKLMVMAWKYIVQEDRCERGWQEENDDVEDSGELML